MEKLNQVLTEFYTNARGVLKKIGENKLNEIASLLLSVEKIYVLGIGHSGMFGRILSMKLNHVGLRAFVVFDEINPPFEKDDLFIAISQSGETGTIVALAEKAKKIGGKVLGVVSNGESTLGGLSDAVLQIEKFSGDVDFSALSAIGDINNQNLLGALFGFNIYILFYALIILLAQRRRETPESINERHANLQ